ncbi:coenzyme F420 hydrogenase [Halorhodospira abdelmalekii]|nr:coenzyme F420 hydrogenase [Halorhodospira abdelmalekii]
MTESPVQFWSSEVPAGCWSPVLKEPAARALCTDCGLSRSERAKRCGQACQFIRPDYPRLEQQVHGRARLPYRPDELHFGPYQSMYQASLRSPLPGAQWTGITTRIAERLLEAGEVDAVLTVTSSAEDRWQPVPVLITEPAGLQICRGMRIGFAPLLALLEPALARGYKRLAVIAMPCQAYPLRVLEQELGFERLDVIGTPCADNTDTPRFHEFLTFFADDPNDVTYLEFRPDHYVELRFEGGRKQEIPFLQLPLAKLSPDFFPLTCRTCVDYTNVLADVVIGSMGGRGEQWLIVRNERGRHLLNLLGDELLLRPTGSAGKRTSAVTGYLRNTERAASGLPVRRMPNWLRPIMSRLMPYMGPRGLEFARARVEMKAGETLIHLRQMAPERLDTMVPEHVRELAKPYASVIDPDGS